MDVKKNHLQHKDDQWSKQENIWVTILGDIKKMCTCGTKGYTLLVSLAVPGEWLYLMTSWGFFQPKLF